MDKKLIKFIRYYVTFTAPDATITASAHWHEVAMRKGTKKNIRSYDVMPDAREIFEATMRQHPAYKMSRSVINWDTDHPDYMKQPRGALKGVKRQPKPDTKIQRTVRVNPATVAIVLKAGGGNFSLGVEIIADAYEKMASAINRK